MNKTGTVLIRNVVFWVGFFLAWLCLTLPFLRYSFFMLPFFVLIAILGDRESRLGDEAKPFYLFILAGIVLSPFANMEGIKDLFLTFAGISIALLIQIPKVRIWYVFWALFAGFVITYGLFGNLSGGFKWNLANSESSFEGNYGFMFALLTPFALMQRRYGLFLIATILGALALKRIALIGELGAILFILIGERRGRVILNPVVMVGLNMAIIALVLAYGSGSLNQTISDLTGQSANQLGMGRQVTQAEVSNDILSRPLEFLVVGKGPGVSYVKAEEHMRGDHKANLHSDLLKLLYEYGLFFFIAFIWLMYSAKSYGIRVAFLFMNILFITDNVLIYYFMLFVLILCMRLYTNDVSPLKAANYSLNGGHS